MKTGSTSASFPSVAVKSHHFHIDHNAPTPPSPPEKKKNKA